MFIRQNFDFQENRILFFYSFLCIIISSSDLRWHYKYLCFLVSSGHYESNVDVLLLRSVYCVFWDRMHYNTHTHTESILKLLPKDNTFSLCGGAHVFVEYSTYLYSVSKRESVDSLWYCHFADCIRIVSESPPPAFCWPLIYFPHRFLNASTRVVACSSLTEHRSSFVYEQ